MDFAFLDSGTGGLPYMKYLKESFPEASCIYLADTKNFPYGQKSSKDIEEAACEAVKLLLQHCTPKAIVLACNTMSVVALPKLRQVFSNIPFIGTVPAIKTAASITRNNIIGLLATERTVQEPYTDSLIRQFAPNCKVIRRGDSQLISFIEHELDTSSATARYKAIIPAVEYFSSNNVDTIVLGCTHFVHVAEDIKNATKNKIQVVDSRSGVVRQALKVAFANQQNNHQNSKQDLLADNFFVTDLVDSSETNRYETLCRHQGIRWGGVLKFQ
ncbi:MAG: glutamate racemase [Spirochaetaceae bacterium]|nr:glutamate racemase [Spirochaetaceae bacterium]